MNLKNRKTPLIMALTLVALGITACGGSQSATTEAAAISTEATSTATADETTTAAAETDPALIESTEPATEASAAQTEKAQSGGNTISGTVTDGTQHSISIQTDDGRELEFYVGDDTKEDYEDGYLIGRKMVITYTGDIGGAETDGLNALSITDAE